jgi:hypothetical protein
MKPGKLFLFAALLIATFAAAAPAQTPTPSPSPRECAESVSRQVDKKLKILAKPDPKFSKRDRDRYRHREITLRSIFCASGKVTDIVVSKGLTADMDAQAIEAARLIQFTPAEKDGKQASQWIELKYIVND